MQRNTATIQCFKKNNSKKIQKKYVKNNNFGKKEKEIKKTCGEN